MLCPRSTTSPISPCASSSMRSSISGVGDLRIRAPDRPADGAGFAAEDRLVERGHRRGLGQAVALVDVGPEHPLKVSMTATGRLAPPDTAIRSSGPALVGPGRGQQPDVHGGHAHEHVDVLGDDQVQRGCPVEPGQQHQGRAGVEAGVHRAGLAERVEQRQAAQDHVVGGQGQHRGGARSSRSCVMFSWVSTAPLGAPVVPEV